MPKISIIMGTYNGKTRISRAIESILKQTFEDWEFIICDDGSNDGTYDFLIKQYSHDSRFIILRNELNKGLQYALNKCIGYSNGDFIARMDDDDISLPERLEIQINFLHNNDEYALVGSSRYIFDNNSTWGLDIVEGERTKTDIVLGKSFIHPSIMIRKEVLLSVDSYTIDRNVKRIEDFDLWCKIYFAGFKGFNLDKPLLIYYEDHNSIRKRNIRQRLNEFRLKLFWFMKLKIKIKYLIYIFKPLLLCLIPAKIQMKIHVRKFEITKK